MNNTENDNSNSKRSEYRLTHPLTAFIETYSSPQGDAQPANLAITKTIDISANGIQVALDYPLPLHSILRLYLEGTKEHEKFILTGEVAWERAQAGQTLIGFRFMDLDNTDIIKWKEYIAECLMEGM